MSKVSGFIWHYKVTIVALEVLPLLLLLLGLKLHSENVICDLTMMILCICNVCIALRLD